MWENDEKWVLIFRKSLVMSTFFLAKLPPDMGMGFEKPPPSHPNPDPIQSGKFNVVSRHDQENTVKRLFFGDQEVSARSAFRGAK